MRFTRTTGLVLSAMLSVVVSTIARADVLSTHDCFANDAMMRIRGCTELLQRKSLDPGTRSRAFATRALGLSLIGRYTDAIKDYDSALAIIPDYPIALNNRAWALFKLGRVVEAQPDVEKSLALDPTSPHAYDTRAHVRQALGQRSAALKDYNLAMRLGGPKMVKLYQCGLQGSGHYIGAVTGIITEQLKLALKECVTAATQCDPLPPDEECKIATS